jgi:hypothetical protein
LLAERNERRSNELKSTPQGLGYCWSVAVLAVPEVGRPGFENLRKRRLERVDSDWVATLRARLG